MKITIDGKEYECQEIKIKTEAGEVVVNSDVAKKETGYERVNTNMDYCVINTCNYVHVVPESNCDLDCDYYDNANYYSSKEIAENNARADKLLRQLRRFSAINRKIDINWLNTTQMKFLIRYDYDDKRLEVDGRYLLRDFNTVFFDSVELAKQAIKEFKDELIWYFTEYKDSL